MVHLRRMIDASVSFNSASRTASFPEGPAQHLRLGQEELPTEEYHPSHASCILVPLQHYFKTQELQGQLVLVYVSVLERALLH